MRGAVACAVVAILSAACYAERERLAPPALTLELDDTVAVAGGTVSGRTRVVDASGVTSLLVVARTPDSSFQAPSHHWVRAESVEVAFAIHVSTAAAGGRVEVEAAASDNQNFTVRVRDSLRVRAAAP